VDNTSAGNTPPMVVGKCPVLRLEIQYRMHTEIAEWPSRYFYGGLLKSGDQDRSSMVTPYMVLHGKGVATMDGGNCSNKTEVKTVMKVIEVLREMVGQKPTFGVITFYAKQKQLLSLEVQTRKLENVVVNTVDGFQGSERDVIIISCVRGGPGGIGFLQDRQRLNVALTRAKYNLIVIGNMETLEESSKMWGELISNAKARKVFYDTGKEEGRLKKILSAVNKSIS